MCEVVNVRVPELGELQMVLFDSRPMARQRDGVTILFEWCRHVDDALSKALWSYGLGPKPLERLVFQPHPHLWLTRQVAENLVGDNLLE